MSHVFLLCSPQESMQTCCAQYHFTFMPHNTIAQVMSCTHVLHTTVMYEQALPHAPFTGHTGLRHTLKLESAKVTITHFFTILVHHFLPHRAATFSSTPPFPMRSTLLYNCCTQSALCRCAGLQQERAHSIWPHLRFHKQITLQRAAQSRHTHSCSACFFLCAYHVTLPE